MKKGIIVTSFGTTYEETRIKCIESIENRIREEFSESLVLRAFTSRMVINKLKNMDNFHVDTPSEALARMKEEGIKDIYIQPLLIIEGVEYEKIIRESRDFIKENQEFHVSIGKPLLSSGLDYERVVEALGISDNEAIVFMGHGSNHEMDISYEKLEKIIREKGYENTFIATVEGEKTIEDVIIKLKEKDIQKVLLKPFMLVAGDHAKNDMASDEDDSWKSILEKNGINVVTEVKGLGEIEGIQNIFIDHLKEIYFEK
jgi:sirohydrochlorin cobaltochelatase